MTRRPNGKWRARYRDASGKEHARHFARKVDADRWLTSVKTTLARGEWVDPALARVTIGDWAARWLADQVNGKAVFGTPKAHHRRSVPLPRFPVDPLSAQIAGRHRDDLVFASPWGGVLRNNNFRFRSGGGNGRAGRPDPA